MTNEEADVLLAISAEPRRALRLSNMTGRNRDIAERLRRETNFIVVMMPDVAHLTDAGYDALVLHCAHNF